MEKQQERHTDYKHVSRNESRLLGAVRDADMAVFGVEEVRALTGWKDVKIYNTLRALEQKGLIFRLKRNCYALEDSLDERLFEIATEAVKPSYISFWTALSYYGYTEQQVRPVQLVSTKQLDDLKVGPHRIEVATFRPEAFYGYQKVQRFVVAEGEKALVDSLFMPDRCGGLNEYAKCLRNSWDQIDPKKLARYTIRFGNRSLVSRMGYIVENLGLQAGGFVKELSRHRSRGYVKLSPGNQKILSHNGRWKIMVNHLIETESVP